MKTFLHSNFDPAILPDVFDELPLWSATFGLRLLESIHYLPGISALDIGFGTGFPLLELAMRLGPSCTVYGIDPWEEAIQRLEKKIAFWGCANIRILKGEAESIPLPDRSLELITSNNGINIVKDADRVFAECARVLKPGGQLVWTMNTDKTMFEFYDVLEQVLMEREMLTEIQGMHRHIQEKRPSVDRFLVPMRKRGFVIKDLLQDQFHYRFADGTAMLNHHFIRLAYIDPWKQLLPEDRVEEIFEAVEKRLNESSAMMGGVKLSVPFVVVSGLFCPQ